MEPLLQTLLAVMNQLQLTEWLWGFVLAAARLLPALILWPWFSFRTASPSVRGAALVVFAALFASSPRAETSIVSGFAFELIRGGVFALGAVMGFWVVDQAGRIIDGLRGSQADGIQLPTGEKSSLLASFLQLFAIVLFLSTGAHRVLFLALADSFEMAPLGSTIEYVNLRSALWTLSISLCHSLFFAVSLASPLIVAGFLVEVGFGLLARAAPNVPVHFLAMPVRGTVPIAVLLVSLVWIVPALIETLMRGLGSAVILR